MSEVLKVREHTYDGDILLYHSSADIVAFDSDEVEGLEDTNNVEDAIKLLNTKAGGKASTVTLQTTIIASAFKGATAPFEQTIKLEGIYKTDNPVVGVLVDSEDISLALKQQEAWGSIHRISCEDGEILVQCFEEKPTTDIPIQLKIIR